MQLDESQVAFASGRLRSRTCERAARARHDRGGEPQREVKTPSHGCFAYERNLDALRFACGVVGSRGNDGRHSARYGKGLSALPLDLGTLMGDARPNGQR